MSNRNFPPRTTQKGDSAMGGMPVRGIGSGIPANQRAAGVRDPERAAALAADPSRMQAEMEDAAAADSRRLARMDAVFDGYKRGLIFKGQEEDQVKAMISKASPGQLITWEDQVVEAEKDQIDAEEAEKIQQAVRDFQTVKPGDLDYSYVFDRRLREITEKDLPELDFAQMAFEGFAEQTVEIRKGFKVTYRTINGQHSLWLERRLHEANSFSQQYGQHWFSMLQLSVSVQKLNGSPIGADLNAFDEEAHEDKFRAALNARLKKLNNLPTEITDLMIANMAWFSGRVRKDLVGDLMERVGNS